MTAHRAVLALALALGIAPAMAGDDRSPHIEDLAVRLDDGRAVVSYRVADGFSAELLERIDSGIAVRFRHRIEVRARRAVPLWPARELARTTVETRVEFDSLTQRYALYRSVRPHVRGADAPAPSEERATSDSREEMQAWMTRLDDVAVFDPGRPFPAGKLRVRVDVALGRRWALFVFPTVLGADADGVLEVPAR